MATMTKQNVDKALPTTWQLPESKGKSFDSDAVIDAYLMGKEDGFTHGMNEVHRATVEMLKSNATKAATLTSTVLDFLKERKINPVDAYLKVSSWDELSVMVLIKATCFRKPIFKEVYSFVCDLEGASERENLAMDFSFAPYSKSFNISCLNADGFALRLKQNVEAVTVVSAE